MTLSAWTRLHATTSSQAKPLDSFQSSAAEYVSTAVRDGGSIVGAVVTFSGICRGSENGEPIAALTLEHYPGMAEAEIKRHTDEAMSLTA